MRLPRDVSGRELAHLLGRVGYGIDHQTSSHIRLTTAVSGEHHVTVPDHSPLKLGTLNSILREAANHLQISRDELMKRLFA